MYIISFKRLEGYQLEVVFEDGERRVADFHDFLHNSKHSIIRRFIDPERFATVRLEPPGYLAWGDNEMDINPSSIYDGEFTPHA